MTPERWREVKGLFDRAMELPEAERAVFLDAERLRDPALAAEVARLLDAHAAAGEFLERPALDQVRLVAPPEAAPERIGPWEIEREIGHGGMGTVYLAARSGDGFRQTVALKIVRRGMDTDFVLERFRGERRILAGLDHPGIARLLDGGSTETGAPYFVMEYIDGRHLLEDARARDLSVPERLRLFLPVCDAVAYAHRHLVVHRDIKPSNVLVTADGVPKLLDFGLAKLLRPDADGADGRTETALRLLTPDYASPEQVRGEPVTTATDIYSLGVVLYELLTGNRPYRATGRSPEAIARAVCEEEPARPSAVAPSLRGDLDNVVLMALRKEPERRYASVEQFAEDVRRYLDGRPVAARKDTLRYRTGKFVTRHKAAVSVTAAAALLLAGATVAAFQQAREARRERAAAERHFNDVRALADAFLFEFHDAIKDLPGATPARELVVRRALEYLEKLSSLKADDVALQREVATAYERVAKVQGGLLEAHLGDTRGARASLAKALAIRRALAAAPGAGVPDQTALAETRLQLAGVLLTEGDAAAAVTEARGAVATLSAVAAAAPADRTLEVGVARGRRTLGLALARAENRTAALAELDAAARTFEALAAGDPATPGYRRELAITHQMIVHALGGTRERDRAAASYARAAALQEELVRADPGNFSLQRELAYTHMDMGAFLEWSGDEKAALESYARAVPVAEALVASDPRNTDARLLLAAADNSVGYGQAVTGDAGAAVAHLESSRRLYEAVAREDPADVRAQVGLARLYESFGTAAEASGPAPSRAEKAREWYARSRAAYVTLRSRGLLDRQTTAELEAVSKKLAALGPG
ncbi:MAG TPA: serine/threonine-protein kinase [Thermoanaerobaculia bacterium]|nr:serine/threonine-protein kinase [Thermoanaerobaculia bacterium]